MLIESNSRVSPRVCGRWHCVHHLAWLSEGVLCGGARDLRGGGAELCGLGHAPSVGRAGPRLPPPHLPAPGLWAGGEVCGGCGGRGSSSCPLPSRLVLLLGIYIFKSVVWQCEYNVFPVCPTIGDIENGSVQEWTTYAIITCDEMYYTALPERIGN